MTKHRGVPYWRCVRYTDDGCSLYQCLACKNEWEGRSAPGWYDVYEVFDHPVEGASKFVETVNGVGVPHWSRERAVPPYKPVFRFCPYCGVKWKGPIRCDVDNERMLGPKRRARERKVQAARRKRMWRPPDPDWWWVLMRKESWPEAAWEAEAKYDPRQTGAVAVYHELLAERRQGYEAKIVKCSQVMALAMPHVYTRTV